MSGDLMEGELYSALREEEASESTSSTNFSGEMHFYEQVEDTKDGIWLVQVVAKDKDPLLCKDQWHKMVKKVSQFGIRTGTFNCSSDPRYCSKRGWLKSTLIMSIPQTNTSKGKVMLKEYSGRKIEVEQIFKWINAHVASRIKTIRSTDQLMEEWNKSDRYLVKMYLFANLDQPPAFYSVLSVKFTGRVEFIFVDVQNWNNDSRVKEIGVQQFPAYVVKTPEGIYKYGNTTGEFISHHAMDVFLRSLQPEVNDLFVLSLVLVNLMAWMDLFITQGATIKRFVVLISTLGTYNSLLIMSWLPIIGFLQLPYLESFYEYSLKFLRYANTTTLASWVRADWTFYSSHPALFLSTYLGHGLLIDYFEKKRRRNNNDDEINVNNLEWLSSLWDWYTSYLFHPIASFQHYPHTLDWEEDPDLLLERLAFPDLWLHPLIPTDYIKNLPTWRFKCVSGHSEDEISESCHETDSDSENESCDVMCNKSGISDNEEAGTHLMPAEGKVLTNEETNASERNSGNIPQSTPRLHGMTSFTDDDEPDWSTWPNNMLHCSECVVCLENFRNGCLIMGLPCGHVFHQQCIVVWLAGGRHCCPVCRWASYKKKHNFVR
ncbi:E3 ubiquitin-protein ligase RNF103 isoform X2 [Hemiscyllium ocellatum]|uniref:E3 ubiquitin-protein ligase RNF103 isoform X2 n=1 Tax=Hemiscyllium ocellatum TaxID=170820 RepID=UPI002965F1BD|nr:E3 ubiquitin-protein ligase RNF103 isoform X2 [Hemiscyllium ocellatum]